MSTLPQLQERLLEDQNLLLRVEATLLFPHIGGYSTLPFDPTTQILEPPRPTEIKALWRWWARAILSAVYGGTRDYKYLDARIGEMLGEKGASSLFTLRISIIDFKDIENNVKGKYNMYYEYYNRLKKDLINLMNDFAHRNNIQCKVSNVEFRSLRNISLYFECRKDEMKKLNKIFKRNNIKLKIIRDRSGRSKNNYVLRITPRNVDELRKIIGENKEYEVILLKIKEYFRYGNIARIFLLSQSREGEDLKKLASENALLDSYKHSKIIIDLSMRSVLDRSVYLHDVNKIKFALWSFVTSLVFGSIGYASRRGFGSIVVESVVEGSVLRRDLQYLSEDVESIKGIIKEIKNSDSPEKIEKQLYTLLEKTFEKAKAMYGRGANEGGAPPIPEVPTAPLSSCFKLKVFRCRDPLHALVCISKATLKEEWMNIVRGAGRTPNRSKLHTWILGLPRSVQKRQKREKRGYLLCDRDEEVRRPSAIHFKLLTNSKGTFIVVYGFLSEDWPVHRLCYKGSGSPTPVDEIDVYTPSGRLVRTKPPSFLHIVFDAAFSFVTEVLNRCCGAGGQGGS